MPARSALATHGIALALLMSGCSPTLRAGTREIPVHAYLFGIVSSRAVDVRDVCASGQARSFEVTRDFWDYAATIGTLGLYSRHRVRVDCEEATPR